MFKKWFLIQCIRRHNKWLALFPPTCFDLVIDDGGLSYVLLFFLFLSSFLSVQYKSNSYKSIFFTSVNLLSSIALCIFSHQQIQFFFYKFSLYISWRRINEFSPWQCLLLWIISIQDRTIINRLKSLIKNQLQK